MKIKVSTLVFLISLLSFGSSFSAAENQTDSVEEKEDMVVFDKITDLNVLYERALNGISDRPLSEEESENFQILSQGDENSFPAVSTVNVSTSQLVQTEEVDGQLVETYETTTFTVLQDEADYQQQLKLDRKNKQEKDSIGIFASNSRESWDSTYGVKSYTTVTFSDVYDDNAVRHVDMSRVTGGWTYNGAGGYSLSSRSFTVGQVGWSRWGSTSGQRSVNPWSSNSFIFGVPAEWKAVSPVSSSTVGVTTTITIKGQGSSWNSVHTNNIR